MRALPSLRRPFTAALAATALLTSSALAAPWALKPGEFYSELGGEFFSARTFLENSDSKRATLGGALEQRSARTHNEIGWKKHASVWLDIPFISRTYVSNLATSGSRTSTGLGDFEFGIRFGMHAGKAPFALALGWSAPLGSNRRLFPGTSGFGGMDGSSYETQLGGAVRDSNAFFDTGLQSLSLALETGGTGSRWGWSLGGGYRTNFETVGARSDTDRYADFLTGTANLAWRKSDRLILAAGAVGEWRAAAGHPYDRVLTPVAGSNGPDLDPSYLLVGPRLTYRVDDRTDVFAGSWHSEGGRNVLHIDQIYAGVAWKNTGLPRLATALIGARPH
jgi:hypothetical protein